MNIFKKFLLILWLKKKGLSLKEAEGIASEYVEGLDIRNKSNGKPYAIGFIGSYGVGKTTVGKELEKHLPLVIIRSDDGRRFIERKGYSQSIISDQKIILFVGLLIIRKLLAKKVNLILDGDFRDPHVLDPIRNILAEAGYPFFLIHVTAPENIVLARIRQRRDKEESTYLKENMERHFRERQKIHERFPLPKAIVGRIETDKELAPQITNLITTIQQLTES